MPMGREALSSTVENEMVMMAVPHPVKRCIVVKEGRLQADNEKTIEPSLKSERSCKRDK